MIATKSIFVLDSDTMFSPPPPPVEAEWYFASENNALEMVGQLAFVSEESL